MKNQSRALNATEVQVLDAAKPEQASVAMALRRQVLAIHPEATILAWPKQKIISFGIGAHKMKEHYAFIALHAAHVNLGLYNGVALASLGFQLQGTGKSLRHVKVSTPTEARSDQVAKLVRAALQLQLQSPENAA
jgi:hypothetical protein